MFQQVSNISKFQTNISILKQVGNDFKLTTMNYLRTPGFELDNPIPKNSVNQDKLSNNITRAKTTVKEIGLCNPWELYLTLTISPQKFDRYNLPAFYKAFTQWIRDYNKKHKVKIKYLLIPEPHSDGAWHLHGFFMGLPISHLHKFEIGDTMGKEIAEKVKRGETVYKWQAYENKFGWNDLEPIKDQSKATNYILKYISKDFANTAHELGAHLYYASKGLKRAEELKRGYLLEDVPVDFQNEHCRISNLSGDEYSGDYLKSIIFGDKDSY